MNSYDPCYDDLYGFPMGKLKGNRGWERERYLVVDVTARHARRIRGTVDVRQELSSLINLPILRVKATRDQHAYYTMRVTPC